MADAAGDVLPALRRVLSFLYATGASGAVTPRDPCYSSSVSTFEERRRARAAWPIRKVALGAEELADPRVPESVDQRIAMVGALTRQQWAFAGLEVPRYTRAEMPGRVHRPER